MPLIGTRRYPKGPNLKFLEQYKFDLSGTQIEFLAPHHNHRTVPPSTGLTNNNINLYDSSLFTRLYEKDNNEPKTLGLCLKDWQFFGVPFLDGSGDIGSITFQVSITHLNEFQSLFRPRNIECAIERYIYKAANSYRFSGECRQNWRLVKSNQNTWINYTSIGNLALFNAEEVYESVWHIPITDQHLLTVNFRQAIYFKRTRLEETYNKLIDTVMNCFKINLSDDAITQKEKVKHDFPSEELSKSLPPYEFETFEVLSELGLIQKVTEDLEFGVAMPDKEFNSKLKEATLLQKKNAKEIPERVLTSHMRFLENKD